MAPPVGFHGYEDEEPEPTLLEGMGTVYDLAGEQGEEEEEVPGLLVLFRQLVALPLWVIALLFFALGAAVGSSF